MGSKAATILGMGLFCFYVASCALYVALSGGAAVLSVGAAIGGVGAGIAWTAQGTYFAETVQLAQRQQANVASSQLAAIFAFWILVLETTMESLSTILVRWAGVHWSFVFAVYAVVAVASTVAMWWVRSFQRYHPQSSRSTCHSGHGVAALWLFVDDSRMKYFIAFNAVYGAGGAFLNSFVSGEVIPVVTNDDSSSLVGVLAAVHGVAAAGASLLFGWYTARSRSNASTTKVKVLIAGSVCFSLIGEPFLLHDDSVSWSWTSLIAVYVLEGFGRATAEGTLKAVFADYFSCAKEGAFAAIILQYGTLSSVAYLLANHFPCRTPRSTGCVEYRDGSLHDVHTFAEILVLSGVASIACLVRVSFLDPESCNSNQRRYGIVASTELTRQKKELPRSAAGQRRQAVAENESKSPPTDAKPS